MWVRAVLSWLQNSTSSSGSPVSCMISLVMLSVVMTLPAHRPQVQGARAQRLHNKPIDEKENKVKVRGPQRTGMGLTASAAHLALTLSVSGGPQSQDPSSCSCFAFQLPPGA